MRPSIPSCLFAFVAVLYILTAISVIFEFKEYSDLAYSYGVHLSQVRAQNHELGSDVEPNAVLRLIDGSMNYAIIALGSIGAISFSFTHWRKMRNA